MVDVELTNQLAIQLVMMPVLCCVDIISQFNKFEVLPLCKLLSDKHNPINVAFNKAVNIIK